MRSWRRRVLAVVLGALWLAAITAGVARLRRYAATPGEAAASPALWPALSALARATDRPTLVVALHPRCPCSRASVAELARLMESARGRLVAYVLVATAPAEGAAWQSDTLAHDAAAIPGVSVLRDDDGAEARRFGARTSGQTVLYGADGRLVFSGGITPSRGHVGDNAGRGAVVAYLAGRPAVGTTPVFGCPLTARRP